MERPFYFSWVREAHAGLEIGRLVTIVPKVEREAVRARAGHCCKTKTLKPSNNFYKAAINELGDIRDDVQEKLDSGDYIVVQVTGADMLDLQFALSVCGIQ